MIKPLTLSAIVIIACISFFLPGCLDTGDKSTRLSGYGEVYTIEPWDLETISLFDGSGSLVEFYSPSVLKQMNIPAETDYSIGYVDIPPGNSTPPHYLLGSGEIIYVISGSGEISIDGIKHELSAGQAVFIPAGSVQSFTSTGDINLEYLTSVQPFYKPEIDILVKGDLGNTTYKSHPQILVSTPEQNQLWNPSEGVMVYALMNPGMLKLSENEILPGYSMAIAVFAPGALIPEHVLTGSNELDYILEGEIEIKSGDNSYILKEGQAAIVPKEVIREIKNTGEGKAVLLSYVNPYWKEDESITI